MKALRYIVLFLLPLIILGLGYLGFRKLKSLRRPPQKREAMAIVPEVRLYRVVPKPVQLMVTGYGTSRFRREIPVAPEVSGRVVKASPRLRVGAFIPKGELLLEIDPTNYRNALTAAQAEEAKAQALLVQLRQQEKNAKRQIEVMRENAKLAQQDWKRLEGLVKTGASTEQEQESAHRAYLLQQTTVVKFENDLALIPPQIQEAEAALQSAQARVGDAQADLDRTRIVCPFPARVMAQSVEVGQVVSRNETVARIADITVAEVPVVIEPAELDYLAFSPQDLESGVHPGRCFPAKVQWVGDNHGHVWQGHVTRIEPVDSRTRTVPVVVQVDNPWEAGPDPSHPPFLSGMYCRVDIDGREVKDALAIPRSALREGGKAYICRDGRLKIVQVAVRYRMEDTLIVASGIEPGDRVIVSPLSFPVNGMKLKPLDKEQRDAEQTMGKEPAP